MVDDELGEGWAGRFAGFDPSRGFPDSSTSLALEAAHTVKSGAGSLFGFSVYSNKASSQFILVFDSQTIPGSGAVPVLVYTVGATSNLGVYYGTVGRAFGQGIYIANSSTAATLTAGSADCWFDVQYI